MKKKPIVWIVDDEMVIREILADYLSVEPYEIAFASNGLEVVTRIAEVKPDLILLDVMMPAMDGFEVCQKLKSNKKWSHIPIILATALDGRADLIRGLDAGADEFLSKPVNGPELRARVRSMLRIKQQYDSLQGQMQVREDLADMVVHDMKNPLATLLLYTDLLGRSDNLQERQKKLIEVIQSQVKQLDSFVNDLLLAAKMESNTLILKTETIDVKQLLLEHSEHYESMAKSRGNKLIFELPESPHEAELDANLFGRVLDNLMSNAFKFSPSDSVITVRMLYRSGLDTDVVGSNSFSIQIIDQGMGIPDAHVESIFNKYQVAKLKKSGVPQTGLGLAFCKMAVEAHGGKISVQRNTPNGSIFTVEL